MTGSSGKEGMYSPSFVFQRENNRLIFPLQSVRIKKRKNGQNGIFSKE